MPRPVIMPMANDNRRRPERTEAIRILKPAMSNIPKSVSATVAAHANDTVDELGKRNVTAPVYSTKRAKFPQDTFFAPYGPHKPKRSATADKKEAPSANRANRRTISVPFFLSCAAFEFIRVSRMNADDRLSLDPLGRVEGGNRIVEGSHFADVCPQPPIPDPLDELTQLGAIGYDDEVDSQAARGPRLGRAGNGYQRSSGTNHARRPLRDVAAEDIENQIDPADIF